MSYIWDWLSRQSRPLVIAVAPLLFLEYYNHVNVGARVLTFATFIVALLASLPTRRATQAEVDGAAKRLKRTVQKNWLEKLAILVGSDYPAEVPYSRSRNYEDIGPGVKVTWPDSGRHTDLFNNYRRIEAGRLLIIGSNGSGKSIAAYNLILEILKRGLRQPIRKGVPIPLSIVGWDGQRKLRDWITDKLVEGYRIVRPVATRLVEEGYILPVFDGLDEVDDDPRSKDSVSSRILTHLNSSDAKSICHGALIVTCRSNFYDIIFRNNHRLYDAVIVKMESLPPDDVRSYLDFRLKRAINQNPFDAAKYDREINRDGSCLVKTLGRPLMLNLAIGALISGVSSPSRLNKFKSGETLANHLIKAAIPTAIENTPRRPLPRVIGDSRKPPAWWWRRENPKPYSVEEVQKWLANVVTMKVDSRRKMTPTRPQDLWRLADRTKTKKIRVTHLILAIVMGLLVAGLAAEALHGAPGALLTIGTAVVGIVFALWAGLPKEPSPKRLSLHQYATPTGLARLLAVAALGALCAVGGAYDGGRPTAITSGIGGTLAVAVVIGLIGNVVQIVDPRQILRNDLLFGSLFGLGVSIAAALPHGLSGGISDKLNLNNILTIPGSAALAIAIAMMAGVVLGSRAWTRYALMLLMTAPSKRVPWRLMYFIKWCYAANLLRISGVTFELRHEEILKALKN